MAPVAFGIFDHVDRGDEPVGTLFEHRLRLVEQADAAGFRTYHVAEHHATPLGMAPSPGIYLAAVAQRTRRLRFGPLVLPPGLKRGWFRELRPKEVAALVSAVSAGGPGRPVDPPSRPGRVDPSGSPARPRLRTQRPPHQRGRVRARG